MATNRQDFADFVPGDFHIDTLVSGILVGYRPNGMIAPELFPVQPVMKQSNVYAKIDKGNWFRRDETLRAPATAPNEVRYTVSSDTYFCKNYELATLIPWETIDNADMPHRPVETAGMFLIDKLMLDYEIRVSQFVWSGVGSSVALTGNAAWSNFAGSDPLTNLETGTEAIRQTTGFNPNTMVCPWRTWLKMRRHPDIVRAIFPGAGVGGIASPQQFADLIGIDRILIPRAIRCTSPEGTLEADNVFTDVWSTSVVLAYVEQLTSEIRPTFGTTFRWNGGNIGANGPTTGFQIERRRNSKKKCEDAQTGYYQDEKLVAGELGYLIATGIV